MGVESFSPDWQNRIRTGQSLIPGLPFLDGVAALRAVNVFDCSWVNDSRAKYAALPQKRATLCKKVRIFVVIWPRDSAYIPSVRQTIREKREDV
jgi:hypothetical protein